MIKTIKIYFLKYKDKLVSDFVLNGNKKFIKYTYDIHKAIPFYSFKELDIFISLCCFYFDLDIKYFDLL